jgi:integrase
MPRSRTGGAYFSGGHWYARVRLGPAGRPSIRLPSFKPDDKEAADERARVVAALADRLMKAGHGARARSFLDDAAKATTARALAAVERAVGLVCSGKVKLEAPGAAVTFGELAEQWVSGALADRFPDQIQRKRSSVVAASYLRRHLLPKLRDVAIVDFTIDHALDVMGALPSTLEPSTRRGIALTIHRVLAVAVWPLRIIKANPIPAGFCPRIGKGKAKSYIYPAEDARLMACRTIPLAWRIFWGFLSREGLRLAEAVALIWAHVDLCSGALSLDVNKTDDPRIIPLSPGVIRAFQAWREISRAAERAVDGGAPVFYFPGDQGRGDVRDPKKNAAERFRRYLRAAGIDRPILFERSQARRPIRAHDTRATMVTLALASGRTETWVQDRTGHKSSGQIQTYRRAARNAAELGVGELAPLDVAIPELAAWWAEREPQRAEGRSGGGEGSAGPSGGPSKAAVGDASHRGATSSGRSRTSADGARRSLVSGQRRRGGDRVLGAHLPFGVRVRLDSYAVGAEDERIARAGR